MLKSINVKDYALIEKVDVEFGKGLNIITGETGAGKTILIDAMSLLLGERASTEVVRKNAEKSIVEGVFEIDSNKKVSALLKENEIEISSGESPELIIRREISLKGSNRCFINDTPVQLNVIKDLGDLLVDLHGQHEHQSLLRKETHIDFIDSCGNTEDLLRTYRWVYNSLLKLQNELKNLKEQEATLKEKKEIYSFQLKEIDSISPEEGEEEKLSGELTILENSEKLLELTSGIYQNLYESENSVYDSLVKIKNNLQDLIKIDPSFKDSGNEFETVLSLLKDLSGNIRGYNSKIEVDSERLEKIRERLGTLNLIKKKYGGTITSVLEYREKISEVLNVAENYSGKISELETKIKAVRESCGSTAEKLSGLRKQISKKVEKEIVEFLTQLGIPNSRFEVRIKQVQAQGNEESYVIVKGKPFKFNASGYDEVEFFISTNPGEDLKPLVKVASGGEVSRIMLALKSILAKNDKLPLLIFDEIDSGISGHIAQKVGQSLKNLAGYHQVIAITHLPQISGLADQHYAVEKREVEGRVISSIKKLSVDERVNEVAKLLSGETITEASLKSARELMGLDK
jgi:DNA repair protein RecN (Recombination protein N)